MTGPDIFLPVEVDRLNVIAQWQDSFYVAAHVARFDPELYARVERNQRLAATDFYALADVAMPPEIAAYRQALRDLPQSGAWAPRLAWDELKGVVVLGVGWP